MYLSSNGVLIIAHNGFQKLGHANRGSFGGLAVFVQEEGATVEHEMLELAGLFALGQAEGFVFGGEQMAAVNLGKRLRDWANGREQFATASDLELIRRQIRALEDYISAHRQALLNEGRYDELAQFPSEVPKLTEPIEDFDLVIAGDGFFSRKNTNLDTTVETDMTLNYGGLEKWTLERIFIDFVQNHRPGDSKGSRIDVTFHLRGGQIIPLNHKRVEGLQIDEVDFIEVSDDGVGYDYEHLKYFLTTKGSEEEGGKFGEGLKIATAAAMNNGMGLEFQSRDWKAVPLVAEKTLNEGYSNQISTKNIQFKVNGSGKIRGSKTIIRRPSEEVLNTAKRLTDLVIPLRERYQPMVKLEGVGEVVEKVVGEEGSVYVKGNRVLVLPNSDAGVYNKPLFNYNIFDDTKLNRDRDNLPSRVIRGTVEQIMLKAATPEIVRTVLEHSVRGFDGKEVERKDERYYETEIKMYSSDLKNADPETLKVWRNTFYSMHGKDAILGVTTGYSNTPSETTQLAIREGRNVVFLSGDLATSMLIASGVETATALYFEKENKISTGVSLNYREKAWDFNRILLDAVQNHLQADSGATEITVEFSTQDEKEAWRNLGDLDQFEDEQIYAVRISDNGHGYDYKLLGILHSTKADTQESAGGWGEGLKILSASALRQGLGLELRSRSWRAEAITEEQRYDDADEKRVAVDSLSYNMTHFRNGKIQGSQTTLTNATPEFVQLIRQLPNKVIALKKNYSPISQTDVGDIHSITEQTVFVQGLEVQDVVTNHNVLLGYNFQNVEGLIPSPDRNILHTGKLQAAIGLMMAQTDSVDVLDKVINEAIDSSISHPEFRNVTKFDAYVNQKTWQKAWEGVVKQRGWNPKKVVLATRRTQNDPDSLILLRNMGYQVVGMNNNIGLVIHSLGVHLDFEILDPDFEYIDVEKLKGKEKKMLALRGVIDRKLEIVLGKTIEPSPLEVFTAVRSKLTGEELSGWQGYWNNKTEIIGMGRHTLKDAFKFGETYLEEMGHRLSGADDYTREFTNFFRNMMLAQIFDEEGITFGKTSIIDRVKSLVRRKDKSGKAMTVSSSITKSPDYGGIDFDPNKLKIETSGRGTQFNATSNLPNYENMLLNGSGLQPIIFQIVPATPFNFSLLSKNIDDESGLELSIFN